MNLRFPFQFNNEGVTAAQESYEVHIRDLVEQVLFTAPGERVNRPDFGSGLLQLVFEPNSDELAATLQFLTQAALNQWLGDRIEVNNVEVRNVDATLSIQVVYTVLKTRQVQTAQFSR
ncbi:MAG: GPW/gp25 family protein [Bacteroidota bacterium]